MPTRGSLLRILGVAFGIAVVVGGMVGQGIFRTPGIIAAAVHSRELILSLWVMGGLLAGINAFAYVELGTAIPCAGGRTQLDVDCSDGGDYRCRRFADSEDAARIL